MISQSLERWYDCVYDEEEGMEMLTLYERLDVLHLFVKMVILVQN